MLTCIPFFMHNTFPVSTRVMHRRAVAWLFVTTVLWSISFVLMRGMGLTLAEWAPAADSLSTSALTVALRYGWSAVVLVVCWRGVGGLTRNEIVQGFWLGLFHGAGLLSQADGLTHTDASISAFLTQCYCVLVPAYYAFRNRVWPGLRMCVAVVLILIGVSLLAGINWQAFRLGRGEAETILCSVFFAAQIICLADPRYQQNRPLPITLVMFVTVALLPLPILAWKPAPPGVWTALTRSAELLPLLAGLVLLSTVAATLLMNRWQQHVGGTEASLIYSTEPIFASVFALFLPAVVAAWCDIAYPNEEIGLRLLVGGGLMLLANFIVQWRRP